MERMRYLLAIAAVAACSSSGGGRVPTTSAATLGPGSTAGDGNSETSGGGVGTSGGETTAGDEHTNFDLGVTDVGPMCEGGGASADLHAFIWIANSTQGTASKINTRTLVEEGRYLVHPGMGDPSRTSVSLSGNVAIANRLGGVTKIYANSADCQDSNGVPGIQTSSGAADILAWGSDECLAWHTPFAYASQRPVAWGSGDWNPATCGYDNEKVWTSGGNGNGVADVMLLDGETGVVEQMVSIPGIVSGVAFYGGAVDPNGDFWGLDNNPGASALVRVNRSDFSFDKFPVAEPVHYGLTVDPQGYVWLCGGGGAARFDPVGLGWTYLAPANPASAWGGCMTDAQGRLWHSSYPMGVFLAIDTATVTVMQSFTIPAYVHGVSIDFDGNVWGVELQGTRAYRLDPTTGVVATVDGLVGAYTYSDMTGFQLSSVGAPTG